MKTALIHEWLVNFAGSEIVLECIYEIYPSPIYCLLYDKKKVLNSSLKNASIISSFLNKYKFIRKRYKNFLAFYPLAIEQFDLSDYDIIISSSHAVAKGVMVNSNQLHICYCHTPIRYAWDLYHQYLKGSGLNRGLKGMIAKFILHYIRLWDCNTINRVDYFIANSNYIAKRIKKIYNRDAYVIYPPVNIEKFSFYPKKENYYLTASRMVPYKKVDLIVEAFSEMPEKKLIVIGDGPDFNKIKIKAKKNVELLSYQPFEKLKSFMQKAKAFVFAAEEDFGIIPVEAQACGTPVIAYRRGGVMETVIENKTGVFFNEQNVQSITDAVNKFERKLFNYKVIRQHAEKFSKERFQKEFKNFVEKKINTFFK